MPESGSSIDRYVDRQAGEEAVQQHREKIEANFLKQKFEDMVGVERELTTEEQRIVELANTATNEWFDQYGGQPIQIDPRHVHMVPEDQWKRVMGENKQHLGAFYNQRSQGIVVRAHKNKIKVLNRIVHEMTHQKSYNAVQVHPTKGISVYRVGFDTVDAAGEDVYLTMFNEALTETATGQIQKKIMMDPMFEEQRRGTEATIKKMLVGKTNPPFVESDIPDVLVASTSKNDDGKNFFHIEWLHYRTARQALNILIEKIRVAHPEQFKTSDDVFDVFFRGMATGNMLPTGKLIDQTFGRGTLRNLGSQPDGESFLKFIQSLPETEAQ